MQFERILRIWNCSKRGTLLTECLMNSIISNIFRLMRINEHGLQERENSRLYTRKPKCSGGGGHFVTASLVDTGPAMLVLVYGFAISAILLVSEILIKRFSIVLKAQRKCTSHKW